MMSKEERINQICDQISKMNDEQLDRLFSEIVMMEGEKRTNGTLRLSKGNTSI